MTANGDRVMAELDKLLAEDDRADAARVLARRLIDLSYEDGFDPEMTNWAYELAEDTLLNIILKHRGTSRSPNGTHGAGRSRSVVQFQAAAAAAELGDLVPIASFAFLDSPHIALDGTFKPLRDFTAKDLSNLAGRYQARAERDAVVAMFYRSLAGMVANRTVGQVFDDERLRKAYRKFVGTDTIEAPIDVKELTA